MRVTLTPAAGYILTGLVHTQVAAGVRAQRSYLLGLQFINAAAHWQLTKHENEITGLVVLLGTKSQNSVVAAK